MVLGSKTQSTNLENLERGSVHLLWENGDGDLTFLAEDGFPRALRVDVAGTLILSDQTPTTPVVVTYNCIQGEILPFAVSKIGSASTASVQIWW